MQVWEHMCDSGQHVGISSVLPSCEFQGPSSGHQACGQAPLPTELSH